MYLVDYLSGKKYKKCKFCEKTFKNKGDLDTHLKGEHSNND